MRKIIPVLVVALTIISFQFAVFAQEVTFSQKPVDSNTMTYIAGATKSSSTDYVNVIVSDIFKSDGSASDYQYVQVRVKSGYSYVSSQCRVTRGTTGRSITLSKTYGSGTVLSLYAMGNDPSLDCEITGSFSVH